MAQLFDLMGTSGRVISIDIAKLHELSHPRVTFLIGDSTSLEIVNRVRSEAERVKGPVLVVLDSDHSQNHVAKEIALYGPFVTSGSYILVQDGVIDTLRYHASARPGPLPAIKEFMKTTNDFVVDTERSERFLITQHPDGWLRRK